MYKIDTNTFYSSFYKIKKRKKKTFLPGIEFLLLITTNGCLKM